MTLKRAQKILRVVTGTQNAFLCYFLYPSCGDPQKVKLNGFFVFISNHSVQNYLFCSFSLHLWTACHYSAQFLKNWKLIGNAIYVDIFSSFQKADFSVSCRFCIFANFRQFYLPKSTNFIKLFNVKLFLGKRHLVALFKVLKCSRKRHLCW